MPVTMQAHTRYFQNGVNTRPGGFRYWHRGAPQTQGDLLNQPPWAREVGGTNEGGGDPDAPGTVNGLPTTIGGAPSALNLTPDDTVLYKLEVWQPDRTKVVDSVPFLADGGTMTQEMDRASELTFRVPYDYTDLAHLTSPNGIAVRDRWGFLVRRFNIERVTKILESDSARFYEVYCQDLLAQLGREPVIRYQTVDADGRPAAKTVRGIVQDLLALQVFEPSVVEGVIDGAIGAREIEFFCQDTSILGALNKLRDALPKDVAGHFYIGYDGALEWRLTVGDQTAVTLDTGVIGYEVETDYSAMANRIYAYGAGQDTRTRLKLTDAGESNEYIDDATSQSTYNIRPASYEFSEVTDADTLLLLAQRALEERKDPYMRLRVNLLDLAMDDSSRFSQPDLTIGGNYTISDSTFSVSVAAEIRRLRVDLSDPMNVDVDVSNRREQLGDIIEQILKSLNPPVDVNDDGSRYPTIPRLGKDEYIDPDDAEFIPGLGYRNGDLKHEVRTEDATDKGYMFFHDVNPANGQPYSEDDGIWTRLALYSDVGEPFVTAADRASLDSAMSDGQIGYTTGTYKFWYAKQDGTLRPLGVLKAASLAALTSLMDDGESGIDTSTGYLYYKDNDTSDMICVSHLVETS